MERTCFSKETDWCISELERSIQLRAEALTALTAPFAIWFSISGETEPPRIKYGGFDCAAFSRIFYSVALSAAKSGVIRTWRDGPPPYLTGCKTFIFR